MKAVARDEALHFVIADFNPRRVAASVEFGPYDEARLGAHAPDELNDGFVVDQRSSTPVLSDVTEEAMLDLVPLAGAGRKVRDADGQPRPRRELLKLSLPQP